MTTTEVRSVEPGATEPPKLTHRQIQIIYSGLMLGLLLAALDQTIVATALPTIVGDLGGLNHLSWVVTAYLLASTSSTPLYGKLGDLYGRKIVFQAAICIFLVGSMLSGLSHTMLELICFRGLQGLGAGGIMSLSMAITGDILSPRERGKYQAYGMSVFSLASVAGPAIGGLFTQDLSWRWCFYVNVPIGAIALVVTSIVLRLPFRRVSHSIDFAGAGLLVAGVTAILLVTVWGGGQFGWLSWQLLLTLGLGIALLGLFIRQERRAPEPILPLHLFSVPTVRTMSVAGFLLGMALFGTTVYLPLFLQLVTGTGPTVSGLLLVPQMVGTLFSGVLVGKLIAKTGKYKIYPTIGSCVLPIGIFLLSTMTGSTSHVYTSLFMLTVGLGIGSIMPVTLIAVQNAVGPADLGVVTSTNVFFRSMGSSFGVAVLGAVMNARLRYWIPRLVPKVPGIHVNAASVAFSPAAVYRLPLAIRTGIIDAFGRSLHVVFLVTAPIALLVFPLILVMRQLPLRSAAYIKSTAGSEAAESIAEQLVEDAESTAFGLEEPPTASPAPAS